ncbi:MAG: class I SAM-dependent methyltransferase [Spirochaetaceae bacterium]|jgi:SAM-dependent methyltransferase|nr:class I SAM-dependent methyltransferase [Spirochaetaceae bacterium]
MNTAAPHRAEPPGPAAGVGKKDPRASALEFDRIADEIFAPIYPVIARRLLELAGVYWGRCIDLGCGGGHLGLAAAEWFEGEIILLDSNPYALELAEKRISCRNRIRTLRADVHGLPFPRESADLLLSRGAMWFWDAEQSLREIWRVLKPEGAAVIGGGYGTGELKAAVYRRMSDRNGEDWSVRRKRTVEGRSPEDFARVLEAAGLCRSRGSRFEVVHEESGDWLVLRKGGGEAAA